MSTPSKCPCCRHRTLHRRARFEVCPVCLWEDDGQDGSDATTVRGGPNDDLSLAEARENYFRVGACHPRHLQHVRPPQPGER